jgi:Flp pilus assembly protein TadD
VNPEQKRAALQKLAALEYQAGSPDAAEKHYEAAKGLLEGAPASEQSQVLNNLAVLHMLRGDPAGAEAPLAQARAIGKNDLPYARTMNNLGVLAELRGDHTKALSLYADALAALAAIADAPASDRQAVEANLTRVRNSR